MVLTVIDEGIFENTLGKSKRTRLNKNKDNNSNKM